ncbi:guanylate kinase [Finegoldia magna]|uniref:guanylate kinase n=1 Tax=Finegoldia magna TaxID=1260 RepID=UPI0028FF92E2|nr:guanylate kinase [Finegoldia magna]MDU2709307.1 guanylate kinase [Finegoldia magna]MDU3125237.1 guanylate kinase [Finegoldia magna]MDU3805203.1 guanylate kinase [Finegoldia magna]MDU5507540.1 guanylate kinase [Finegoldia magna]
MRDGFLLVVSGPSGVGKGTVCEKLISQKNDIVYSVSATTRKKRPYEIDGENYYFLSLDEFKKKIEQGDFIEYANVHNNYYGTPKSFVFDQINKGEIVILEIDVQGALKVKENYPEAVFVFILPPDLIELRRRIEGRNTEDEETINIRMQNAKKELSFIDEYDYAVINEDVDETVRNIETIIDAEKFRVVKGEKYD